MLARLALTDDELERFTGQLADVLDHFADIDALDLDGVEPMTQPYPLPNVLRAGHRRRLPRPRRGALAGARRRGRPLPRPADPGRGAVSADRHRGRRPPGRRSAVDVVDEHLARIDERDGEIHAFNLVLADEARAAAAVVDDQVAAGDDPGPLAGVPVALKDNLCTRGIPTTCSSRILEGWQPPYTATVVDRVVAAGAVVVGKTNLDEFAMGSSTENSAFGPTRNPHDPTRVPGGSSGGQRGGGGGRLRPAGARLRHRRLDPPAGGAVRRGRREADLRRREPLRADCLRVQPRPDRPAGRHRRRRRHALRGHRRPRPARLDVDPGPGPSPSCRRSARASTACASASSARCVRASTPTSWPGSTPPPTPSRRPGAKVDEVSVPAVVYGLTAYYLIAPAEASSNLARYDGVRYGLRVDAPDTARMNAATRAAGFGDEVKRRIMLGTYALSAGYYDAYYGKALKVRRLIARRLRARLRAVRPAAVADRAVGGVRARRQDRRSVRHVPERRVHHPVEPGRPSGHERAVRHRRRRPARRRAAARPAPRGGAMFRGALVLEEAVR